MAINMFSKENLAETFTSFPPIIEEYVLPMTYYDDETVFSTARTYHNEDGQEEMPLNFQRLILKDVMGRVLQTDSVRRYVQ